jgi:hypothetical protein
MWFIILVIIAVVVLSTSVGLSSRGLRTVELHRTARVLQFIGFISLLAALALCLTVVPAGHVGVIDFFGRVSPNTLKAGINLVNPLARVIKFQ